MNASASQRYDPISQFFHWATALAVLGAYVIEPNIHYLLHEGIDPGTSKRVVLHETLGILVLLLTVLRLIWTAVRQSPPKFDASARMRLAARITQGLLWALVVLTPVSALFGLAHDQAPLTLLGGLRLEEIPWISATAMAEAINWSEVHEVVANTLILVAGAHAVAALLHHFVLKDGVLVYMLPKWRRK